MLKIQSSRESSSILSLGTHPRPIVPGKQRGRVFLFFTSVVEGWLLIYPPNKITHKRGMCQDNSQIGNQSAIRKGKEPGFFLVILRYIRQQSDKDNPRTATA